MWQNRASDRSGPPHLLWCTAFLLPDWWHAYVAAEGLVLAFYFCRERLWTLRTPGRNKMNNPSEFHKRNRYATRTAPHSTPLIGRLNLNPASGNLMSLRNNKTTRTGTTVKQDIWRKHYCKNALWTLQFKQSVTWHLNLSRLCIYVRSLNQCSATNNWCMYSKKNY